MPKKTWKNHHQIGEKISVMARTVENSHSFFNVSYTLYKSLKINLHGCHTLFIWTWAFILLWHHVFLLETKSSKFWKLHSRAPINVTKPSTSYILGFVWKNYLCIEVIRALESVHKKRGETQYTHQDSKLLASFI